MSHRRRLNRLLLVELPFRKMFSTSSSQAVAAVVAVGTILTVVLVAVEAQVAIAHL
jgi:hypothetical protein